MPLSASQETVLDEIIEKMPTSVTWCIFGSTDSVLRGLDDIPADIDTLAMEPAAEQFREVFSGGFTETREVGHSQIDEYQANGEELEVIYSRAKKDNQKPLVNLDDIELEMTDEREIPMLPLKPRIDAYRRIHKNGTAERLEATFKLADG